MQKEKVLGKIKRAAIGNYCPTALQKTNHLPYPKIFFLISDLNDKRINGKKDSATSTDATRRASNIIGGPPAHFQRISLTTGVAQNATKSATKIQRVVTNTMQCLPSEVSSKLLSNTKLSVIFMAAK